MLLSERYGVTNANKLSNLDCSTCVVTKCKGNSCTRKLLINSKTSTMHADKRGPIGTVSYTESLISLTMTVAVQRYKTVILLKY